MEQLLGEVLNRHALDFMFTLYPHTDERFYIEVTEGDEHDNFPDEYDTEDEEREALYFHLVINGIPIDKKVTCIQVGIYIGNI